MSESLRRHLEEWGFTGDFTPVKRGGQADVFRLTRHGEPVAVKVYRNRDDTTQQRALREIDALARLAHPNICGFVGADEFEGHLWCATEWVNGWVLGDLVFPRRRGLELTCLEEAFEALASALAEIHGADVVHRDLKPDNIMMKGEPDRLSPVIIDFGISLPDGHGGTLTAPEASAGPGTPGYLAPERYSGSKANRASDLYALGIVFWEMSTGHRYYRGSYSAYRDAVAGLRRDPRRLRPDLPRALARVTMRLLHPRPARRYRDAGELLDDLRRYRDGETVHAPRITPWRHLFWLKRYPGQVTLGLFTLIVATMSFLFLDERRSAAQSRADLLALRTLALDAGELWPPHPALSARLEAWCEEAREVLARLDNRAWPGGTGDEIRNDILRLEGALDDPRFGVATRAREADRLRAATTVAHEREWRRACDAIRRSPHYGGLHLEPLVGLVPLGPDPHTGYEEFLHWPSHRGPIPVRDFAGRLAPPEDGTGIILVLLPGGDAVIGDDASESSILRETPRHTVPLDPFFIAKHELTRAQWSIRMPSDPSYYVNREPPPYAAHPVHDVRWDEAVEVLRRFGLLLPTEGQWEYACRAGTTTAWSCGDDASLLSRHANLAGSESTESRHDFAIQDGHEDPFYFTAPVGRLAPNGFGLHDMHGNVAEWCRDLWKSSAYSTEPLRPGDGLRLVRNAYPKRPLRGGSFAQDGSTARSAYRGVAPEDSRDEKFGLRASLPVTGLVWDRRIVFETVRPR